MAPDLHCDAKPRRAHRRGGFPHEQTCLLCNARFTPRRAGDQCLYCSHRCRTAAYRAPKNWALITWAGQLHAEWTFHPFRAAALAAAPRDEPFTVVDTAIPVTPHPPVPEFLRSRFIEGAVYPNHQARR